MSGKQKFFEELDWRGFQVCTGEFLVSGPVRVNAALSASSLLPFLFMCSAYQSMTISL